MGAGGGEGGAGNAVVARGFDQAKPAETLRGGFAVADDLLHRRAAALLDAAERLFLERGDAAVLVAGRGVLVDGLAVAAEVVLELVHHAERVVEGGLRVAAVEERGLGAEHLGDLGQDRGAAPRAEAVGDATDQRVGGDAAEAVAAAALHAEHQFARGDRLALELRGIRDELAHRFEAVLDFILHVLRVEKADALRVERAGFGEEGLERVVLAAEAEDQHRGGVRVADQAGEDPAGVAEVVAELRAAVGMGEGVDAIDRAAGPDELLRREVGDALAGDVDAGDRVDDPDLVAGRRAAIGTAVAEEGGNFTRGGRGSTGSLVFQLGVLAQAAADLVDVDVLAGGDVRGGDPDREAVLDHRLTRGDRPQRRLVAGGDVGEDELAFAGSRGDGLRGDGDIVVGVDVDEEFHDAFIKTARQGEPEKPGRRSGSAMNSAPSANSRQP